MAEATLGPKCSLRTPLLGMAVFGAGLRLFQRLDRQRQLVARIEAMGDVVFITLNSVGTTSHRSAACFPVAPPTVTDQYPAKQ